MSIMDNLNQDNESTVSQHDSNLQQLRSDIAKLQEAYTQMQEASTQMQQLMTDLLNQQRQSTADQQQGKSTAVDVDTPGSDTLEPQLVKLIKQLAETNATQEDRFSNFANKLAKEVKDTVRIDVDATEVAQAVDGKITEDIVQAIRSRLEDMAENIGKRLSASADKLSEEVTALHKGLARVEAIQDRITARSKTLLHIAMGALPFVVASLICVFIVVAGISAWFMFSSATGLAAVAICGGFVIATVVFGIGVYWGGRYITVRYRKVIEHYG